MLELKALAALKGERLLYRGVNARLEPGTLLQIAGDNGAGKTTLLRQISGLSEPTHGEILWNGHSVRDDRSAFHQEMLFIGHLPGIKDDLDPIENLEINASIAGETIDRNEVRASLIRLGLEKQLHLPAMRLSAGQRRRVALARLWITQKKLWILDEPFTALDRSSVERLQSCIENHVRQGGLCLYTTHQSVDIAAPHRLTVTLSAEEVRWA